MEVYDAKHFQILRTLLGIVWNHLITPIYIPPKGCGSVYTLLESLRLTEDTMSGASLYIYIYRRHGIPFSQTLRTRPTMHIISVHEGQLKLLLFCRWNLFIARETSPPYIRWRRTVCGLSYQVYTLKDEHLPICPGLHNKLNLPPSSDVYAWSAEFDWVITIFRHSWIAEPFPELFPATLWAPSCCHGALRLPTTDAFIVYT